MGVEEGGKSCFTRGVSHSRLRLGFANRVQKRRQSSVTSLAALHTTEAAGEGGTKFSGCTAAGVPSRTPETQTTASTIINPHSPRCPRPQPSLPRSRHPLARTTPRFPPGALSGPPHASDVDDTRRSFSSDQIGVQEYTLLKSEGPGPLTEGSPLLMFARLEAGTGASCLVITSVNTYLVQKRGYTRTAGDRELHATRGVGGEWK